MILAYTLLMPRATSSNGRWSGDDDLHIVTRSYQSKKRIELARRIIDEGPYHYNWNDGWGARIDVHEVGNQEAAAMRRKSVGLAGYDWMIDTIEEYGKPLATHEIPGQTHEASEVT